MPTASDCSLYCQLARKSSKAAIFRRGPSKQTCLIAWNRFNDTFEVGQWFKGRVYADRGDISANGEWLLVFMGNFRRPLFTWTVLSRLPYFSAVALWPKGDTWGGGGTFLGDNEIVLSHEADVSVARGRLPSLFKVHAWNKAEAARLERAYAKDERRWTSPPGQRGGPFMRNGGNARLTMSFDFARRRGNVRDYHFLREGSAVQLDGVDWAEFDDNDDLLFSRGGELYRLKAVKFAHATTFESLLGEAKLLADFSRLTFQAVKAPYAAPSSLADRPARGTKAKADSEQPAGSAFMEKIDGLVTKEDRRQRKLGKNAGRRR